MLIGEDPRDISRLWERMYNGSRDHFALDRGRVFPILGRRGVSIAAIAPAAISGGTLWSWNGREAGGGPIRPGVLFARVRDERGTAVRFTLVP